MTFKDLTGMRFSRLLVLFRDGSYGKRAAWRCRCDCGKELTLSSGTLGSGNTKSCGCLRLDRLREVCVKHGLRGHELRSTHNNMMARCFDEKHKAFKWYGARGIGVHEKFMALSDFIASVEGEIGKRPEGMTLDRIRNDGDYAPGNIRWATKKEQARNTRQNNVVEFKGKHMCMTDWAVELGINVSTLRARLRKGWGISRAFTEDVK